MPGSRFAWLCFTELYTTHTTMRKRTAPIADIEDHPPPRVRKEADEAYFPDFLPTTLKEKVKEFLWQQQPEVIKFGRFKVNLTSRSQRIWGVPTETCDLPLYAYGTLMRLSSPCRQW